MKQAVKTYTSRSVFLGNVAPESATVMLGYVRVFDPAAFLVNKEQGSSHVCTWAEPSKVAGVMGGAV